MKSIKKIFVSVILVFTIFSPLCADIAVLPRQKQVQVVDRWLEIRLRTLLPDLMRREKIDMWIVICREYNEDPVFPTLVPANWMSARRLTMLVFHDPGGPTLEKLTVSRYPVGDLYKNLWYPKLEDQWQCLAKLVADRDPKRIGIDRSDLFAFGDGLSASLEDRLIRALGPKYAARLCSAEKLAVGWLEKRIPEELETYPQVVAVAHRVIAEAFSNRAVTPGVTTTKKVEWYIRNRIEGLGLKVWFHPDVDIQRQGESGRSFTMSGVIRRGDLLHCDVGLTYLRLNSDNQEMGYVLRRGEKEVPAGLREALKRGNRLQDILTAEFRQGKTGNQILVATLKKARAVGLNPAVYSHPLGFHGHAAGAPIGLWDHQEGVPGSGDFPLYYDTCYSIELNVKVAIPEWRGQVVRIGLEQDAQFSRQGVVYLDGRQTTFHIIR